jgi:AcrR family transcriptional regulator
VGTEALSLREVARELQVSPAAPYRHFEDKDVFLDALSIEGWRDLAAGLAAATDLRGQMRAYGDFAKGEPELVRLMVSRCPQGEMLQSYSEASTRAYSELARAIYPFLMPGVSVRDQYRAGLLIWALVHGLATLAESPAMAPFVENIALGADDPERFVRFGLSAFGRPSKP